MAVTSQVLTIGTIETQVVYPSVDTQRILFENLAPSDDVGAYSRAGNVFLVDEVFTLGSAATTQFSFTTGVYGAQFEYYSIDTNSQPVRADLIEAGTITTNGTTYPAYNLNRNEADTYDAVLEGATALTGGTAIVTEIIASDKKAGGGVTSGKIVTLEPSTEYGFKFTNQGNQNTDVHFQLGFSERFNGGNAIWLGGTADSGVKLNGGEKVELTFYQGESLTAIAETPNNKLAILKRD